MGAWGMGSFENDDAADWVYEFEGSGASAVASALEQVSALAPDEYLEAPEASVALAAAEIIAAVRDGDLSNLSESAREALTKHKTSFAGSALSDSARTAVERILAQSELRELWEEGEGGGGWLEAMAKLLARLR
jgi:Domain of unknown function (DUF4259)